MGKGTEVREGEARAEAASRAGWPESGARVGVGVLGLGLPGGWGPYTRGLGLKASMPATFLGLAAASGVV